MKKLINKTNGLIKGAPTAVFVSALVHLGVLLIAGGLVVFTIVQKQEKKFEPPPAVKRPKMELKKPKVKVKKWVRPQAAQRISSKNVQSMTGIQLPETTGMTEGLGKGFDGFELMPDPAALTLLGSKRSMAVGNDWEGTFYSLSLDRRGKQTDDSYERILHNFFESGWNPRSLAHYYRWPQNLYTTFVYLPTVPFEQIPRSFGIPDNLNTEQWLVHYTGKIKSQSGGKYRLWGRGLAVLAVRINKVEVGFFGWRALRDKITDWRSSADESYEYYQGRSATIVGDWFELEPDVPVEIDIVFGDFNGYDSQATLCVQEAGTYYPKNRDNGPILPVFKTAQVPKHLIEKLEYLTVAGDQNFESDLIFNVY
ncbi:hypothetical protein [Tichowtungia aerotolerans]|uniref:Uncharacterized protein n=1 Tax=Tichowtungia aerotolerans TaxID=2697043 RepID=A0A6P1M3G3_9BACT|nr:hypothetical protein [Tichowtungia aerotolerans]QHI68361.1 hypothetical protein GT409_02450 [Tichowtungia aerotolerans]